MGLRRVRRYAVDVRLGVLCSAGEPAETGLLEFRAAALSGSLHDELVGEDPRRAADSDVPVGTDASAGGADTDIAGCARGEFHCVGFGKHGFLMFVGGGLHDTGWFPNVAIDGQVHVQPQGQPDPRAHRLQEIDADAVDGCLRAEVDDGLQVLTFPAEPGEAVIDRSVQAVDQGGGAIGGVFRAESGCQREGSTYGQVVDGYALQDGAVTLTVLDR